MSIVKTLLSAGVLLLLTSACASAQIAQKTGITVPDALAEVLGEQNTEILLQADIVSYYVLRNEPEESTAEPIHGYFRYNEGIAVQPDYVSVILFLLPGNPDNFVSAGDSPVVMAPFLPFQEFVFKKGKDSISLLISTSDMTWTIAKDGQMVKKYPYTDKKAVERLLKAFSSR